MAGDRMKLSFAKEVYQVTIYNMGPGEGKNFGVVCTKL